MIKLRMAGAKTAELFLYERIGAGFFGGGVDAKSVADELKALGKIETIMVRINSEGGSVFDGFAIYNLLARHPARIEVDVDGMALSIASVIAMAGDTIRVAKNSMMMIHDPHGGADGSAEDLRRTADLMDQVKVNIVDTYATRTGQSPEKVAEMMTAETWLTAEDAVALGFADAVTQEVKMAATFDPSRFKNVPKGFGVAGSQPAANVHRVRLAAANERAKGYGLKP